MYLLLASGWVWRILPGAMKGFQLSGLNFYLHFSLAVSWALKFCVLLPPEYIHPHPKFMLNINKVNACNKALCSKFLRSAETNGSQQTGLMLQGQSLLSSLIRHRRWHPCEVFFFFYNTLSFVKHYKKIGIHHNSFFPIIVKEMLLLILWSYH